jgi:hypothetical protein
MAFDGIETIYRGHADLARQKQWGDEMPGKDFWQIYANALMDWPKTARMCVLISATNLNVALLHCVLAH